MPPAPLWPPGFELLRLEIFRLQNARDSTLVNCPKRIEGEPVDVKRYAMMLQGELSMAVLETNELVKLTKSSEKKINV